MPNITKIGTLCAGDSFETVERLEGLREPVAPYRLLRRWITAFQNTKLSSIPRGVTGTLVAEAVTRPDSVVPNRHDFAAMSQEALRIIHTYEDCLRKDEGPRILMAEVSILS